MESEVPSGLFSMRGKFVRKRCQAYKSSSRCREAPFILLEDATMKSCIFVIACVLLQVSHQSPMKHWTLLPHNLVVEVDGTVGQLPLSCLDSPQKLMGRDNMTQDIIWMKNGEEDTLSGNSYTVQLEESLGGGNYTCHGKDGSLLNHTVVLIKEGESERKKILVKTDQGDYLRCSAQNYNGEFHCSWTWHSRRVGKVVFIEAGRVPEENATRCSVDASVRHWTCSSGPSTISCSVDHSGNSISCALDNHCPYAEETQRIHISIYVRTNGFLVENYAHQFFLSEIVKPDKVRITKVNTSVIAWTYPSSWSSPFSYFPLTFEIAQLKGRCRRCDNPCTESKAIKPLTVHSPDICQFAVKHKTVAVCIRAKDALCNSHWSEWSHLRLRRNKNRRKKKNKRSRE